MMSLLNLASAAVLLAVLGVLTLAIGVLMMHVFAWVIGWRALAKLFPASAHGAGLQSRNEGVVLGAWGWNAPPLRVEINDSGVLLSPRAPFGIAFKEIGLPWTAILSVEPRHFMLFDVLEVRYGEAPEASIGFVAGAAADAVAQKAVAHGALPLPLPANP